MEINELFDSMDRLLDAVDTLKSVPGSKAQRKDLLNLFDKYSVEADKKITAAMPDTYRLKIPGNLFIKDSPFGFLFRFSPRSMIYCQPLSEGHMNRQYCWFSKSICRQNRDGSFAVQFYPQSYFQMFDVNNKREKTKISSDDMLCIILASELEDYEAYS